MVKLVDGSIHPMRTAMLAVALAVIAGAGPAYAAVSTTSITSPTDDSYLVWDAVGDTAATVSGLAPGATNGDMVDINCYHENGAGTVVESQFAAGVAVENQAFTVTSSLYPIKDITCRLRAVPTGTSPADLSPFSGPAVAVSEVDSRNYDDSGASHGSSSNFQIVGGPNAGEQYDYYIDDQQFSGGYDFLSVASCGPCDSWAIDPSTFRVPDQLFNSNAALFGQVQDAPAVPDRSYIKIDGDNAYAPYAAQQLYARSTPTTFDGSEDAAHLPALTFSDTIDPTTGDLTIHEGDDFVRCATPSATPDPAPGAANHTNCPDFTSTGVHLSRTIVENQAGREVTVTDTFSSTDGQSHALDMLDFQSVNGNPNTGFNFPWVAGGVQPFAAGQFVPAAPAGSPTQIYTVQDTTKADGDESVARGGVTLSAPPQGVIFEPSYSFDLAYRPTVPAHGTWTYTQALSTAFTQADVDALASAAATSMMPGVAIHAPNTGATVTSQPVAVSGTVTAGGNGLPSSVDVNGVSVAVSSTGAFSAKVPLAPGANTVTASFTDAGGLPASAQAAVKYSPPPPASSARITKIGHDSKHLLITLACNGASCTGSAGAVAKLTVTTGKGSHRKRRTIQITVASGRFSVPAGATQTIKLGLTSAAKLDLKAHTRLRGTATLTLTEPNRARSSLTGSFSLK